MALEAFYIDEALKEVVTRTNTKLSTNFKFFFGETDHVIKIMGDMKALSETWNPLVAVVLPIPIQKGKQAGGYYGSATIPRIVFAALTDSNKSPEVRKETVIKPIIHPFYTEFLKQLSKQKTFAIMGVVDHVENIRYGTQPAIDGWTEHIDGMEMLATTILLDQQCI